MKYYVKADRFLLEKGEIVDHYLVVENGQFGRFVDEIPTYAEVVDWSGYTIAPGLFDTHIHGIASYDVMDGNREAIEGISHTIAQLGVTRFLPTTLTSKDHQLEQSIRAIIDAVDKGLPGAKSEGIFLEGPYFTESRKGAQNARYFRDPNEEEVMKWQTLANGAITKIAIAPERDGSIDFIRWASRSGICVSVAHTEASYDCCSEAVAAGANTFVHLFNGMSGLHHREPGVVGAAFMNDDAFAELICDGHHVHPDMAKLALRLKGEKLVLITDCMRAGLMPDGPYTLGEFKVNMKEGIARTETGSLAGSTLTLLDGVKNVRQWTNKPLHEVWHLASLSPAKSIGKDDKLGSISPGKQADYVVLDTDLNVQATVIDGIIKYERA